MNTLILLIDFEGEKELQDQNYLHKRYIALANILSNRDIDRENCLIVFNTYNKQKAWLHQWSKPLDEKLRALNKFAWINKWQVFETIEETETEDGSIKDIDIEFFIDTINKKAPKFEFNPKKTKIIIGGTETAGCCLESKKLGALHWVRRDYDTTMYLPLMCDYSTDGNTWYEKQQHGFVSFWKTVTYSKLRPDYYKKLSVEYEYKSILSKLPIVRYDKKIEPIA